ncbi:hypothetical protein M0R04_14790 [Candidatus Dojkabacteria bacterium]|jgi:hypothetical protein|nr:hypothetical protein [Candidatus Dojkabacteria bacterium]
MGNENKRVLHKVEAGDTRNHPLSASADCVLQHVPPSAWYSMWCSSHIMAIFYKAMVVSCDSNRVISKCHNPTNRKLPKV